MAAAEARRGAYAPDFSDGGGFGPAAEAPNSTGRGPLILGVSAAVAVAFAAVCWSAYNQGVREGGRDAPPLIPAPTSPMKSRQPADDARPNPDAERTVYRDRVERAPPAAAAPVDISEPTEADFGEPLPDLDAAEAVDLAPAIEPIDKSGANPGEASPVGPRTLALEPEIAEPEFAGAQAAEEPEARPSVGLTPSDPAPTSVKTAAVDTPPVTARGAEGGFVVQVAALRSRDQALDEWRALTKRHTSLLTGRSADIITVDDGGGGAWHRLRVAAFETRDDAARFCDRLQAAGQSCLVSKR